MNDFLNCLMSLMLPFALIPTVAFSSSYSIMGNFANGLTNKILATLISLLIIAVNIYFVIDFILSKHISNSVVIVVIVLLGVFYLVFCLYLALDAMIHMGFSKLAGFGIIQTLFKVHFQDVQYQIQSENENDQGLKSE